MITSQYGMESENEDVTFHPFPNLGNFPITLGSEIGLLPEEMSETTSGFLSMAETLNPASKNAIAVGRPTYPRPTIPISKSRDSIREFKL